MIVKIIDSWAVSGGKAIAICDDQGNPLPGQIEAALSCEVGEGYPVLTVTFAIDGKKLRLEG